MRPLANVSNCCKNNCLACTPVQLVVLEILAIAKIPTCTAHGIKERDNNASESTALPLGLKGERLA